MNAFQANTTLKRYRKCLKTRWFYARNVGKKVFGKRCLPPLLYSKVLDGMRPIVRMRVRRNQKTPRPGVSSPLRKTPATLSRATVPVPTLNRPTASHLIAIRSPRNPPLIRRQPGPNQVTPRLHRRQTELSGKILHRSCLF